MYCNRSSYESIKSVANIKPIESFIDNNQSDQDLDMYS